MTSIYLAGKIDTHDWRQSVTTWTFKNTGDKSEPWPVLPKEVLNTFDLTGPYFIPGEGHDGYHGLSTHGRAQTSSGYGPGIGVPSFWPDIYRRCLDAIDRSDIIFAWLDDPSAFGTIFELGYAAAKGKRIVIGIPESTETWRLVESHCSWSETCWIFGDGNGEGKHASVFEAGPESPDWTPDAAFKMWFPLQSGEIIRAKNPHDALSHLTTPPRPSFDHSPIEALFWDTFHQTAAADSFDGYYRSIFSRMTCQEPVGNYRIDFAFPDIKLAVEIDGHDGHKTKDQRQSDYARERFLQMQGWQVVRFTGSDVYHDKLHCVADVIEFVLTRDAVLQHEAKS